MKVFSFAKTSDCYLSLTHHLLSESGDSGDSSKNPTTDHEEYQCARLDENNCTFYKMEPETVFW